MYNACDAKQFFFIDPNQTHLYLKYGRKFNLVGSFRGYGSQ